VLALPARMGRNVAGILRNVWGEVMTVQELIEKLQKVEPPNTRVFVDTGELYEPTYFAVGDVKIAYYIDSKAWVCCDEDEALVEPDHKKIIVIS